MKLTYKTTISISPTPPFHFDSTFHKPDHFPSKDSDWQPGVKWQTFYWQGKQIGVKFENQGTIENPKIKLTIFSGQPLSEDFVSSFVKEVKYRYNFDLDLGEFYKLFSKDKVLGPVIKRWRGMRPGHPSSLYEYLIIGIVLQNATVKRSVNMLQALFENFGKLLEFDGKKLWCFWKPGGLIKVPEEKLRELKLGYRAKFIKKIDEQFAKGEIDELSLRQKDRETQRKELLKLYGVGPATVWYLLFDVFHYYDFFDHISPWEQKIYSKLFFNQDPNNPVPVKKLLNYFERYKPYQQLAVNYIWEDLWWRRKEGKEEWLNKLIRL